MNKRIYLDNNATTAVDPHVVQAMVEALITLTGNPSSAHAFGRESKQALTRARDTIANCCGVTDREIVFTSGGTEAMNLLIRGFLNEKPGHVITTDVEHSAVFKTLQEYESVAFLKVGASGAATLESVKAAIRPDTRLISLMAANNETGVKTDIEGIADLALHCGIPFIVDGVAHFGKDILKIPKGVAAMAFSGHKFHAPKGIGFAFIRRGTKLKPLFGGGDQEFKRRSGTENLSGIIGLAKAVEIAVDELPAAIRQVAQLRDYFEEKLKASLKVCINGEGDRICNTSNVAFEGMDGETLLANLDRAGIAASHGSACSSGALEPSRVLLNMGLSQERARSSIRFSLSRYTTQEEIDTLLQALLDLS